MKKIEDAIAEFRQFLLDDGKSAKTIESYIGDIVGLVNFLKSTNGKFNGQLKRCHITNYRTYLINKEYKPSTINKKVNSFHMFNVFLVNCGWMREIVVDVRKDSFKVANGSEDDVEIIEDETIEKILDIIGRGEISARNRLIVYLLIYTGLRVSELCSIKIKNIDMSLKQLRIVGKGGKFRELPLKEEIIQAIKEYLPERAKNIYAVSENLLIGQRGIIHRDAVDTVLENISRLAGLETKLKPHSFRHAFCTKLINKGVPITTVAKLAGHSSIETTSRFYINCSKADKIKAVSLL